MTWKSYSYSFSPLVHLLRTIRRHNHWHWPWHCDQSTGESIRNLFLDASWSKEFIWLFELLILSPIKLWSQVLALKRENWGRGWKKRWGRDWLGYLTGPCLFPCPNMLVYWIHSRWASGAVSTFVRLHNPVLPTLKFTADRNGCKSENIGQNIFYCSAPAPAHQPLYDSTEWEVKHALDIEAAQHRHEI